MGSETQVQGAWSSKVGVRASEALELSTPCFVVLTLEPGTCFHLQNYFQDEIAIPKNPKCNETKAQDECPWWHDLRGSIQCHQRSRGTYRRREGAQKSQPIRPSWASLGVQMVKNLACSAGDLASVLGSGRSPGEGNGYPLQYSRLENPMDRGAWRATVHGVAVTQIRLSHHAVTSHHPAGGRGCVVVSAVGGV